MSARKTILLVDDDRSVLTAWMRLLKLLGYRVETAEGGAKGFDVAKQVQPDLIVTDWLMPDISGIALCRRFRSDATLAKTPLILATSEHRVVFDAPIWDDLWQKPVPVATMRESIERLLA